MLKSLKKYLKSVWIQLDLNSIPQQTDMMLFSIDRLLYFHSIHLHLQKRVNKYFESNDCTQQKIELEECGRIKKLLYNYIRLFLFVLLI